MKTIYIFGASKGGEMYLKRLLKRQGYAMAGFIDNDSKKHGTTFQGFPVFSPDVLREAAYDEVHLASMWAMEIRGQLQDKVGVASHKIIDLPKSYLKGELTPFATPAGQLRAKALITDICELFSTHGVYLILDGGCLLGTVREGQLLPWDNDIDFTTRLEEASRVVDLLKNFVAQTRLQDAFEITLDDRHATTGMQVITLLFVPKDPALSEQQLEVSFTMITRVGDKITAHRGRTAAPGHLHEQVRWIELHPGRALCAARTEDYLTLIYGGDWRVVKKDISYGEYDLANFTH